MTDVIQSKDELEDLMSLLVSAGRCALLMSLDDANRLVQTFDHASTVGPIFEPTAYLQNIDNLETNRRLTKAFARFRAALEAEKSKLFPDS